MASARITSEDDSNDCCWLCAKNYNRIRPSLCHCKHCSKSLCLDCVNEHNNELLQNVAAISHHYNELQEVVKTKQKMIDNEASQSLQLVNEYFEVYTRQLRETQQNMIKDIGKVKQDAQTYISEIQSFLHKLGSDIQVLAKEGIVRTTKIDTLSIQLQRIEQQVNGYQVTKTKNLKMIIPEFSLKFQCSSIVVEDVHQPLPTKEAKPIPPPPAIESKVPKHVSFSLTQQIKATTEKMPVQSTFVTSPAKVVLVYPEKKGENLCSTNVRALPSSAVHYKGPTNNYKITAYTIDRMASDGENILYASFDDFKRDLIVYSCLQNDHIADRYREWNQPRIADMIWWNSIGEFVCSAMNGIYTVSCTHGRLKIMHVIRDRLTDALVSANTNHLFMWVNPLDAIFHGIEIFSTSFAFIRKIDLNFRPDGYYIDQSDSFCATDNMIASIFMDLKNHRHRLQVDFYDLNMNRLTTILLGRSDCHAQIRSDGKDRFFVTTGERSLYIVSLNGKINTISLENKEDSIAILDNNRIAVRNGKCNVQLITYSTQ